MPEFKDQQLESTLQNAGLNAPRLTPFEINKVIALVEYYRVPNTTTNICSITLTNGYVVNGESACISDENYDEQIGREIAFENARDKIWILEGYLLKQRLYESNKQLSNES